MLLTVMDDDRLCGRAELESLIAADLREMSIESDQLGRLFAASQGLRPNDFRALIQIMVAEMAGQPMTSSDLSQRMGVSGAAITYLVDRLIESGHIRRDSHPADRRKTVLRFSESGSETAKSFFTPLGAHSTVAMAGLPDADLSTAHVVLTALIDAMRQFQKAAKPSSTNRGRDARRTEDT